MLAPDERGMINESVSNYTIVEAHQPFPQARKEMQRENQSEKQREKQREKRQYAPGLYHQPVYPVQLLDPLDPLKGSVISNYELEVDSIMTKAPISQIFVFEFLGMFIFVYGLTCYTSFDQIDAQVVVSLLFAIIISGYLSGANFNPTVTLSNVIRKQNKYTWKMFGVYCAAQLLAAFLALIVTQLLNDVHFPLLSPKDTQWMTLARIFLSQLTGCFVLVLFILQVSNPNTTFIENELSGFVSIIIFVHIARVYAISSLNALNPAISFCAGLIGVTKGDWEGMKWFWLWTLGDIAGAILATIFYDYFYEPTIKKIREIRRQSTSISGSQYSFLAQEKQKE